MTATAELTAAQPDRPPPTSRPRPVLVAADPAQQLAAALGAAKRAGRAFDDVSPEAIASLRWAAPHDAAALQRAAIAETLEEWRAAYEDRPTRASRVLPILLEYLGLAAGMPTDDALRSERLRIASTAALAGTPLEVVAGRLGTSARSLREQLRAAGMPTTHRPLVGSLPADERRDLGRAIATARELGASWRDVQRRFGVWPETARRLIDEAGDPSPPHREPHQHGHPDPTPGASP